MKLVGSVHHPCVTDAPPGENKIKTKTKQTVTQDRQDKDKIWKVVTQQFLRVFSRKSKHTKLIQFFTLKLRTVYDVKKDKFQGQKRVRAKPLS